MYRTLYTILISFLAVVYCQTSSADVFFLDMGIAIDAVSLADKLDIDLVEEANNKIETNHQKYPIESSKDNAIKYNRSNE